MANRRSIYDFALLIGAQISNNYNRVLNQAGDRAERVGQRLEHAFDNACGSAVKKISGVSTAMGGLAAGMAVTMDAENRKLQAQLGATAEEMAGIKAASAAVFKTGMVEDISEANTIILELSRTMESLSNEDKAKIGTQVAALNLTYDMDTAEVTRAADTMMKNFGVSAAEAMDYIGWGMQNNLDFSGEFLDTLNEYGPQFRDAGFSANEMFAILKAGTEGGAWNLDKVGDAAKEFGLRIKDGSKTTADAMAELSLETQSIFNDMLAGGASTTDVMSSVIAELSQMDDQVQAFQIAQGLFGTMSEELTLDTLYNLQSIGAEAIDTAGTVGQMTNTLQGGVGVQLKGALNTGKLALSDLGQEVLTVAMPAIDLLIGGVEKVSDWFIGLDDHAKKIIVTVGGVAAAVGPVTVAVAGIGKAITVTGGAIRGITTLVRGAGAAIGFFTSPVGMAIGALALLTMGLYYIGTHIDEIQEAFIVFGAKVGNVISGVKKTVIGGITSAVDTAKALLSNLGTIVGGVIKMPINAGINVVNGAIGGINQLAIDVPSWVPGIGGKHLGFNIPTIPALATGGIAVAPTLAMIGEGKESEAILPLSKLNALLKMQRQQSEEEGSQKAVKQVLPLIDNRLEKSTKSPLIIVGESNEKAQKTIKTQTILVGDEGRKTPSMGKIDTVKAEQLGPSLPSLKNIFSSFGGQKTNKIANVNPLVGSAVDAPVSTFNSKITEKRFLSSVEKLETVLPKETTAESNEKVNITLYVTLNGGATEEQAMDLTAVIKREMEKYKREEKRLSLARA